MNVDFDPPLDYVEFKPVPLKPTKSMNEKAVKQEEEKKVDESERLTKEEESRNFEEERLSKSAFSDKLEAEREAKARELEEERMLYASEEQSLLNDRKDKK